MARDKERRDRSPARSNQRDAASRQARPRSDRRTGDRDRAGKASDRVRGTPEKRAAGGGAAGVADRALLFGRKPFIEVVRHRPKAIKQVYILERAATDQELTGALRRCEERGVRITSCSREELEERLDLSGEEVIHQGLIAEIVPAESVPLDSFIERALTRPDAPVVLLDQVTDPRNLGSIFRAADSAGAAGLIMPSDRSAPISSTVRKTSAGASELVPYSVVTNLDRAIQSLKSAGYWIIGAAVGEGSRSIYETELPLPAAVVLGAEGRGLRRLTAERCDLLVSLPMAGRVESLNVGQAAAVIFYELLRRRTK